jgi:hypothetical protein
LILRIGARMIFLPRNCLARCSGAPGKGGRPGKSADDPNQNYF